MIEVTAKESFHMIEARAKESWSLLKPEQKKIGYNCSQC